MKTIIALALTAPLLAACSSTGGFVGSPNGYGGQVSTIWADAQGFPTFRPLDTEQIVGTRGADGEAMDSVSWYQDPTGRIASGLAARLMAKGFLCSSAPQAPECGGTAQ